VILRTLAVVSLTVALGSPAIAGAQTESDVALADAFFKGAKQLADAGRFAEACPKFAESQRLATGIGVTMHLAECYEKTGRTASAWAEFREAEKLAREHEDPRADVAKARAAALDRKLSLEQANTFFNEARQLRDAGHRAEACPKFAASQRLVPAVGVTMYLADCYESIGRTASAWTEFREAERLAREKKDARESPARARAKALEPKLRRLTIAVSDAAAPEGSDLRMDGEPLAREQWNVALAVDPVDHAIRLQAPGRAERVLTAHVQADSPPSTVRFDDADDTNAAAPVALVPVPAAVVATPPAPTIPVPGVMQAAPAEPKASTRGNTRQWVELGLVGGAVVGVGVGAAFLVAKNDSMTNGGPNGSPHTDAGLAAGSAIGFGIGGAALVSAIVLYLATPQAKESAFVVAPVPLVGGAGAFVGARF
jgi:tetratricopeptide (TPR) repeat protein